MPAMVVAEPLSLACVFSDGSRATFSLAATPCPQLAHDLLVGLVELIHPHGTVDAARTVGHYMLAARRMASTLAVRGFGDGAAELTRAVLVEYWMGATVVQEACTRRMLQAFDAATGALDPHVRELAQGRAYNPQPFRRVLPPYTETEWARLTQVCGAIVGEAFTAHKNALVCAERGQRPNDGGWTDDNLRWLLMRIGPVGTAGFGRHLGYSENVVRNRGGILDVSAELFPSLDVVIAYRLLFGIYSGIVPDGIDDIVVDDIDWAGDSTILLSYVKRRTAAESLTLPRRAVRLLEQWLAHSALLRSHADPLERGQLWLRVSRPGGATMTSEKIARMTIQQWLARHGVKNDDDGPLKIHQARVRTTHLAMRDKNTWTGSARARIDPNHSPQVEGDHYLTATTPTQRHAVEAIVQDAQHDLLRRAHPPVVVTDEDAAALARDYPQLVATLELDDAVIVELVAGERDVFVAACADQLSGLHGPKGKPCPARPWVCLLCPLAVFAPRHAANLLRLKAFFSRQWQQMPAAQFMAVFGPYSQRIAQILDRFDPAVLTQAAEDVSDRDDEVPLRPEEATR